MQILLAMMTGAPGPTTDVIRDLLAPVVNSDDVTWWSFVDAATQKSGEAAEWAEFQGRLGQIRALIPHPPDCAPFRKWAAIVARYSFYSGRVLLGAQGTAGGGGPR